MGVFRNSLAGILFVIMGTSVFGQAHVLRESLSFENYAMAGATTGLATGIGDVYKNPAGLVALERNAISTSYGQYLDGTYTGFTLSFARIIKKNWVVGVTFPGMQVTGIPQTVSQGGKALQIGTGTDREWSSIFSVGWKASSYLKLGTNLSYYKHTLFGEGMDRFSLDLGSVFEYKWLSAGLSVNNLGAAENKWSTGYVEEAASWVNAGVAIKTLFKDTVIAADARILKEQDNQYSVGVSTKINDYFMIQGGIYDLSENPALRLGTRLTLGDVTFHYAYGTSDELGMTQKFGLTVFY